MTLSIITINLNNCNGLKRTIDSVISQTFKDFEWIVIDGGSTDGSKELIEQYADLFAFWVSEPDNGIYNAMNKGIAHAKGTYLQFLNSGDWLLDSNVLSGVFQSNHTSDILYGNAIVEINKNKYQRIYHKDLSLSYLINHPINHQASFYKRSLYNERLFDEQYLIISDYLFLIESAIRGASFEYVDLMIVFSEGDGLSSSQMGIDDSRGLKKLLPDIIQRDIDQLNQIAKHESFINSHKSLKLINIITKMINHCAEKTLLFLYKIKGKNKSI